MQRCRRMKNILSMQYNIRIETNAIWTPRAHTQTLSAKRSPPKPTTPNERILMARWKTRQILSTEWFISLPQPYHRTSVVSFSSLYQSFSARRWHDRYFPPCQGPLSPTGEWTLGSRQDNRHLSNLVNLPIKKVLFPCPSRSREPSVRSVGMKIKRGKKYKCPRPPLRKLCFGSECGLPQNAAYNPLIRRRT